MEADHSQLDLQLLIFEVLKYLRVDLPVLQILGAAFRTLIIRCSRRVGEDRHFSDPRRQGLSRMHLQGKKDERENDWRKTGCGR
jgi:hypothetical protein